MSIPISGYELVLLITSMSSRKLDPLLKCVNLAETDFLELKSDVRPKGGQPEPGYTKDDYYWNVTKGLIALANSSGGMLVIGIHEKNGVCEHVDLNMGDKDKYTSKIVNWVMHRNRDQNGRSKWEVKDNGKNSGTWSIVSNRLEDHCNPNHMFTYNGHDVLVFFVEPVPENMLKSARFNDNGMVSEYILKRMKGMGRVEKLKGTDTIQDYQRSRNPLSGENFDYFMKFLEQVSPDDPVEIRRNTARRMIQDLREHRPLRFDPLPDAKPSSLRERYRRS